MEKKQGFFSALRDEIIRNLSPAGSRSAFSRWRLKQLTHGESVIARSGSLSGETLAPVYEGPDEDGSVLGGSKRVGSGIGKWVKGQLSRAPSMGCKPRSDLRLLLGVMGAPLAPVRVINIDHWPHLSIKDTPIEASSAQYILQQYTAASGVQKLQNSIKNAYVMGKVKMVASEFETSSSVLKNKHETGGFVLWQMNPDMWYIELSVGGIKVQAGCNGNLVWRHTPWLGAHTAKGPVRPLRRELQGLDPRTTASMFTNAKCIGEKKINGEDCFILKLCADPQTLKARSEGAAEIIRHVLFGYFSQKTGLIVHIEDSHLTRIQTAGNEAVYWETTINSSLGDYRSVEGVMIAHSGHSVVTLFRFGDMAMSHTKTCMEELWSIEEIAFNVPGLSIDCFIPPADLKAASFSVTSDLLEDKRGKSTLTVAGHRRKVAALA
ncbi:hypothetical protein R6Q59_012777 [Mikania micrantha]|uniref:Uncharacterized protein n=1 Tax=Mikania micrantha TaxID=192012 RepID=A0A5N6LLU3_9ASTR|nr:hypothetical protein E3N88_40114 [Mikania micrantha]